MLNLLIAVMGDSFEKVKVDEAPHAMFEQAETIVEYERLLIALGLWDSNDKDKFPRYMIIAEEVETQQGEETADGITGRMRKRVDALENEMKRQHEETKQQHKDDVKRQHEETKQQHQQHEEEFKRQHEETKRQHEETQHLLNTLISQRGEQ